MHVGVSMPLRLRVHVDVIVRVRSCSLITGSVPVHVLQGSDWRTELNKEGTRALQLVLESLQWDAQQPLALHLHIHITEAAAPLR